MITLRVHDGKERLNQTSYEIKLFDSYEAYNEVIKRLFDEGYSYFTKDGDVVDAFKDHDDMEKHLKIHKSAEKLMLV